MRVIRNFPYMDGFFKLCRAKGIEDGRKELMYLPSFAVVGIGGVGSTVLYTLSNIAKDTTFYIYDNDVLEFKNLGRGLWSHMFAKYVGKPKKELIIDLLSPFNCYYIIENEDEMKYIDLWVDTLVDCRDNIQPIYLNHHSYIKVSVNADNFKIYIAKSYKEFKEKVFGDLGNEAYTKIYPEVFLAAAYNLAGYIRYGRDFIRDNPNFVIIK